MFKGKQIMNYKIFVIALIFGFMKYQFFGWNLEPSSGLEVICDGFMFLIFALSMFAPEREKRGPAAWRS